MDKDRIIVADQNIPFISDVFSDLGKLVLIPGQFIDQDVVKNADILLVRAITPITRQLLEGSSVTFVGSATAGVDHVDISYLQRAAIEFAHAPGANALSVVEYVLACLALFEAETGSPFIDKTIGIVGVGNVGSLLAQRCRALGMKVLINDPPKEEKEGKGAFTKLHALFERADIVSIHTPLTVNGVHQTQNLINKNLVNHMKPGAWFIHTARGGVCDERALVLAREQGGLEKLALDVWQNEPTPNADSISIADIATGHIAGYSIDAKIRGLHMVRSALLAFLGLNGSAIPPAVNSRMEALPVIEVNSLAAVIRQLYPVRKDDHRFRIAMKLNPEMSAAFHAYRAQYPVRRTFAAFKSNRPVPKAWEKGLGLL